MVVQGIRAAQILLICLHEQANKVRSLSLPEEKTTRIVPNEHQKASDYRVFLPLHKHCFRENAKYHPEGSAGVLIETAPMDGREMFAGKPNGIRAKVTFCTPNDGAEHLCLDKR